MKYIKTFENYQLNEAGGTFEMTDNEYQTVIHILNDILYHNIYYSYSFDDNIFKISPSSGKYHTVIISPKRVELYSIGGMVYRDFLFQYRNEAWDLVKEINSTRALVTAKDSIIKPEKKIKSKISRYFD